MNTSDLLGDMTCEELNVIALALMLSQPRKPLYDFGQDNTLQCGCGTCGR